MNKEIYDIHEQGLKDLNKIRHDNRSYWHLSSDELSTIILQLYDVIDHINDFIAEVKDEQE